MNINLGNKIKKLRTECSVTQENLAEYLGISFQAVSKWETGTTMPDITMLPRLAAFFGVRIDELFSIDHDDEFERIDNMLQREAMTDQNYAYAKRILDSILKENPDDVEAIKRYAKIYLSKTNSDLLKAGSLLEKAMELTPMDEEIFSLYRAVRGGSDYKYHSDNDWFIRVCEPYAQKYPQNSQLYRMLIEAMIGKKYYDRAEHLLEASKFTGDDRNMHKVLLGDIALAKGDEKEAKDLWSEIPEDDWLGQYEIGERYNRLGDYEKAIECFDHSYEAQETPHKMDMMYSIAFLYKKLGRFSDAKKEWELIAETLIKEYNMPEDSNDILWAKREIEAL